MQDDCLPCSDAPQLEVDLTLLEQMQRAQFQKETERGTWIPAPWYLMIDDDPDQT